MIFSNKPPRWDEKGREPSLDLQKEGFKAGYKPPAPFFNYLFNKLTAAISEIQKGLSNVDNTADIDKPISTAQKKAIDNNVISGNAAGNPVIINDAANAPFNGLTIYGASEQATTTGKNLCPRFTDSSKMGVTLAVNDDGSITLNGTATGGSFSEVIKTNIPAGNYVFSANNPSAVGADTTTAPYIAFRDADMNWLMTAIFKDVKKVQTFAPTNEITSILLAVPEGVTLNNFTLRLQVEQGTTSTEYEPFTGGKPSPSPDYPQVINSVGDNGNIVVKSYNKNLVKNTATTQTKNGITFTVNNDGTVVVNGTATADASLFVFVNLQNVLKVGEKYILNGCPSGGSTDTYYMEINHIWYGDTGNGAAFTYKTGITGCYIIVRNGITVTNEVFKPMIRLASIEDDTYEPHTGTTATVPISEPLYSIGSIKNKIGLKENVKSLTSVIFDGSIDEDWHFNALQASGKYSYYVKLNNAKSLSVALCNAFVYTPWYNNPWEINKDICSITGDGWFYVYTDFSTIEELREYLANKPITVVYELAEVVTTELTTEQLLALQSLQTYEGITNVFADDLASLEVDYFKNTANGKAASLLKAENNMLWKTLGDVNSVLEDLIGGA